MTVDNVQLTIADERYDPQLKSLWRTAFPADSGEFVDYFFDVIRNVGRVFAIVTDGGEIVSMLSLIDYDMRIGGDLHTVGYIYGAATAPGYRGTGRMAELLDHTADWCRDSGFAGTVLVPADDGLRRYYEKHGFTCKIKMSQHTVSGLSLKQSSEVCSCGFDRFVQMRGEYLSGMDSAIYPSQEVYECFYKKNADKILKIGRHHYAFCSIIEDKVLVRETSMTDTDRAAAIIAAHFGTDEVGFTRPLSDCGDEIIYALYRSAGVDIPDDIYMNLMIDW
ncbi:MAG: GNAT family N-acetyltransferase [Oscillospiraceae bacterium]|nr:GNAT family N-acetyltransferase [Oscillospiraceae bacterium]